MAYSTINKKIGECSQCDAKNTHVVKVGKELFCYFCNQKNKVNKSLAKQKERNKVRSLVDNTKFAEIKKVSDKLKNDLAIYNVLRKDFLIDHPKCECGRPDCKRPSNEVHHTKGRGKFLNDVSTFKALARICHRWAHDNHAAAKELGLFLNKN